MRRRRLLVVEDDCAAGYALTRMLEHMGYEVECVETVAAALNALDEQDAVILDLNLPDGLGTVVLDRIRGAGLPHKVLVVTASSDPRLREALATLRPDGFMVKPVDIASIAGWLDSQFPTADTV